MQNLGFEVLAQEPQVPMKPDNIYDSNHSCKPKFHTLHFHQQSFSVRYKEQAKIVT